MSNDIRFELYDLGDFEDSSDYQFFEMIGKRAAANAINENKALGLPVTYLKEKWVVREYTDGRIEKIVKIESESRLREFKKGEVIHIPKR
ncbi:hypothetical protein [Chitinophaga qingshengii]|uniref:Uncharacterized protein n=1 Tax=Chitinophaga qingshengii TaxID=1569794 RepID=A0ABR7TXL3_9BACT|nr:hypothetical protein [Chitinophaga qingshengii]MBC9934860.1 hypothetical protein [Chitinophaga qingshengii]